MPEKHKWELDPLENGFQGGSVIWFRCRRVCLNHYLIIDRQALRKALRGDPSALRESLINQTPAIVGPCVDDVEDVRSFLKLTRVQQTDMIGITTPQ